MPKRKQVRGCLVRPWRYPVGWKWKRFLNFGPQESIVISYFFTIDVLLTEIVSSSHSKEARSRLRTETPEDNNLRKTR